MTNGKDAVRILHVVGGLNKGGLEAFIMNVYRKIDRSKIQFDFAVLNKNETYYFDEVKKLGGNIYIQPDPKEVGLKKFEAGFRNTIINNGPFKCVHSHIYFFNGPIMKVAKKCNISIRISHSHNTKDGKSDSIIRNMYRLYMKNMILKNATDLVGCSKLACEALYGEVKEAKVICNAIDLNEYNYKDSKEDIKLKLGLDRYRYIIGHIGRFAEQKNHKYIILVFKEFLKIHPDSILLLIGEGPLKKKIETMAETMGISESVHFLGVRDDISMLLGSMDILLFPSLFEGLPVTLVEAQASGVECLISDTISNEIDFKLGTINKLSIKENPKVWAEKMDELLNKDTCDFETRFDKIKENGYEINEAVKIIESIYLH